MRVLLSNDDGVDAPGLLALRARLAQEFDVDVVAPERNWSACGHQRTLNRPLRATRVRLRDGSHAFACDGSPADCVTLALLGLVEKRPDIVIAGINQGGNLGLDFLHSGTFAAASVGALHGLPAMAISLNDWLSSDFDSAADVALTLVAALRQYGAPTGVVLNVNVPAIPPAQHKGIRMTRLGTRHHGGQLVERRDPFGVPYYWTAAGTPNDIAEPGSDIEALASGYTSVTPVALDATSEDVLDDLRDWPLSS